LHDDEFCRQAGVAGLMQTPAFFADTPVVLRCKCIAFSPADG